MKSDKRISVISYLCSVVFYILAIVNIFAKTTRSTWVMWLCLGSMALCLGAVYLRKSQNDDDSDDGKE